MNIASPSLTILGKKIAFSALVQYGGKAIQIVLAGITLKLISNFLADDNHYATYAAITEYALFFSVAANLGIFANVIRKMADEPTNGKIFINSLFLRVITAGGFFLVAMVVLFLSGSPLLFLAGTALFLAALLFEFVTSVCDGMLQANYMMGKATIALVIGRIINLGCVAGAIKLCLYLLNQDQLSNPHPLAIVLFFAATLLGSLVTAGLSFYFVRKKIQWQWQMDKAFMIDILKTSLPFGIISLLNSLYFRFLPDYFGHHFLTDAQFGSFNISFRIAQVVSLFSTFLMFSALPAFKKLVDLKDWGKARQLYKKLWWLLAGSGVLLVVFGSLFGAATIEILTHKKYFLPEFWFVLPLMLLLAAISYGYDLILITLFALEKDLWFLKREVLALALALIFFGASLLDLHFQLRLLLIILGAIVGEGTMVLLGSLKIRKIFAIMKP